MAAVDQHARRDRVVARREVASAAGVESEVSLCISVQPHSQDRRAIILNGLPRSIGSNRCNRAPDEPPTN
jgi:hypothetical protein